MLMTHYYINRFQLLLMIPDVVVHSRWSVEWKMPFNDTEFHVLGDQDYRFLYRLGSTVVWNLSVLQSLTNIGLRKKMPQIYYDPPHTSCMVLIGMVDCWLIQVHVVLISGSGVR